MCYPKPKQEALQSYLKMQVKSAQRMAERMYPNNPQKEYKCACDNLRIVLKNDPELRITLKNAIDEFVQESQSIKIASREIELITKNWGMGEYIGASSMLMGAAGNQIGSHMNKVSRFAPIRTLDGRIVAQATRQYRFGSIPGVQATKLGAGLRIGGNLLGGFGIAYTGYQIIFNDAPVGKGLVDIGFGVTGFLGPIGLGISIVYFIGDTFIPGGWEAVPQHQYNEIQMNSKDGVWFGAHNHFK